MFDWVLKTCKYCGKSMQDCLMEKLSDNCHKSPTGEHEFVANKEIILSAKQICEMVTDAIMGFQLGLIAKKELEEIKEAKYQMVANDEMRG